MTPRRAVVVVVLVVVATSVGVGAMAPPSHAATRVPSTAANASAPPLGESISTFMQSNAAQTEGTVENGMWAAAFANASNASEKRALVRQRIDELNGTLAELHAERAALRAAFRNGTINRTTYRAQLSTVVGGLAAFNAGVDETAARSETVGVNRTRLDQLRTQARNLTGPEVSRLARNLTGGQGSPGPPGLFEDGPPGQSGKRGPGNASNGSSTAGAPGEAGNTTGTTGGQSDASGNSSQGGSGQGPPDDPGSGAANESTSEGP